jgi:hypothetical protein
LPVTDAEQVVLLPATSDVDGQFTSTFDTTGAAVVVAVSDFVTDCVPTNDVTSMFSVVPGVSPVIV